MTEAPLFNPLTETLDAVDQGAIRLIQPRRGHGYRFSVDAVLLADFVKPTRSGALLDIGTGCGVIPLILLHRKVVVSAVGIDVQDALADLARRNADLNGCAESFSVHCADVRQVEAMLPAQSVQLVTINPPFFSLDSGRENPNRQEECARREHHGGIREIVRAARYALAGRGKAALIFPAGRLGELMALLENEGLPPKRMRLVYGKPDRPARLALVESVPGGRPSLVVEPPVVINDE